MKTILFIFICVSNLYSQSIIQTIDRSTKKFTYHEKNCVQYLHSLLKTQYNIVDSKFRDEVYIKTDKSISNLLKSNSPITKGVCEALVKRGIAKYTNKPNRGDIFQFWIVMEGWKPSGHCGVIKEVLGDNKYLIISSYNESGCNGYCESVMDIKDMQIYYIWFVHLN